MRENIRRELDTEYEAQRAANRDEEARRLAHAAELDPMVGALVAERARVFQESARNALAHPGSALDISRQLTQRIADLQSQLRDRLVGAGLVADYLQPVYRCAQCHDTGYVGEPIRERCPCFQARLRERVTGDVRYGMNPRETFALYDEAIFSDAPVEPGSTQGQRAFMARLRDFFLQYAERYPDIDRPNLLLIGMSGLGKTYMLNCIGNHLLARGVEVYKLTAYQMFERMRASIFDNDPDAMSALMQAPLLLLDDLGVEPMYNNITIEQLFSLLNERQLAGRHTIVSTNLMPDEITGRYSERVGSRLFDKRNATLVQFKGRDVRMRT